MGVCPLCNSMESMKFYCPMCNERLEDSGKITDFFDPYGHYNDDETVKMADGYPETVQHELCPHLFYCPTCAFEKVQLIKER